MMNFKPIAIIAGVSSLLLTCLATAQQPGFGARTITQPVVVTPPITNPTVLRALNPTFTTVVPATISPPVWGYSPWTGPVLWPGVSTPPYVIQQMNVQFVCHFRNSIECNTQELGELARFITDFRFFCS